MNEIKKELDIYAVLTLVSIILTVLFTSFEKTVGAIACASLYRQSLLFYDARLICDNRVLTVPTSIEGYGTKPG